MWMPAIVAALFTLSGADSAPAMLGNRDFIVTRDRTPGYWAATTAEAVEAKAAVVAFLATPHPKMLRRNEEGRQKIMASFGTYYLQFQGVSMLSAAGGAVTPDPGGERNVLVRGFCRIDPKWLKAVRKGWPLTVFDGGPCFFDAYYDLATKRVWLFDVHGIG